MRLRRCRCCRDTRTLDEFPRGPKWAATGNRSTMCRLCERSDSRNRAKRRNRFKSFKPARWDGRPGREYFLCTFDTAREYDWS